MKCSIGLLSIVVSGLLQGTSARSAAAQTCATVDLRSRTAPTTFVVGQKYVITCQPTGGCSGWTPTSETGWCYKTTGTITSATNPGSADCLNKTLVVELGSGNDTFAPVPAGTTVQCDPFTQLRAFDNPILGNPRLKVQGREGADLLFGGPAADTLISNLVNPGFWRMGVWIPATTPADGRLDTLCGMGGADSVTGDADNSANRECLIGGSAAGDTCDGGFNQAAPYLDVADSSCELALRATATPSSTCPLAQINQCNAAQPPAIWSLPPRP
jgi:hypothetical protein